MFQRGQVFTKLNTIVSVENEDQKTIDYYVSHANHFYYQIRGGYRDRAENAISIAKNNFLILQSVFW
mgnify:CR=1 FL=1